MAVDQQVQSPVGETERETQPVSQETNFRLYNEGAVEIQMISFKWAIGVIVRPPPCRKYSGNTAAR